jgi:hypothetical protein
MTELTIAALALLGLFVAYIAGRLQQALIDVERDRHLPYRLRAGLDDLSAIDTDALLETRDALLVIEARLHDKHRIMAEIRNGRYDPEQSASPRRIKTNGK